MNKISVLSNLTVGAEIEIGVYQGDIETVRAFVTAQSWDMHNDSSLSEFKRNYYGEEYVSPVLQSCDAIEKIRTVVEFMQAHNTETNPTCGGHVHIGLNALYDNVGTGEQMALIGRIIENTANVEAAIFYYSGGSKRMAGQYARPVRPYVARGLGGIIDLMNNRYFAVNMTSLMKHHTVEFRIFEGSNNPDVWEANVKIALGIVVASVMGTKLPVLGHNDSGLRTLETLFDITPNSLTGTIDPEYIRFRQNVRLFRKTNVKINGEAMNIWKRFLSIKGASVRDSQGMRDGYTKLRETLPNVLEVMDFSTPEKSLYILRIAGKKQPYTLTLTDVGMNLKGDNAFGSNWSYSFTAR
jgi:putative amidoligase enzyme